MSENYHGPTSGNANENANRWPEKKVTGTIAECGCKHKQRCGWRSSNFVAKLRKVIPREEWTSDMREIAYEMGRRRNGYRSIMVYAGHEEKVKSYSKPSWAVIERLGHAAFIETDPSEQAITKAVAELYRYSPNCEPAHRIDDLTLYGVVRSVFKECLDCR
jgi:hypothetical protein